MTEEPVCSPGLYRHAEANVSFPTLPRAVSLPLIEPWLVTQR